MLKSVLKKCNFEIGETYLTEYGFYHIVEEDCCGNYVVDVFDTDKDGNEFNHHKETLQSEDINRAIRGLN